MVGDTEWGRDRKEEKVMEREEEERERKGKGIEKIKRERERKRKRLCKFIIGNAILECISY